MENKPKIHVVDDDQDFRESLSWLLEGAGHQVECYSSAEGFLLNYKNTPGCLLLDVRMNGMSGLTLQQELIQLDYPIPVIIITGHGDVPVAVQAMKNNALDFIEKPFDDEVLLAMISNALSKSEKIFYNYNQQQQASLAWQSLSKREKQVAELVAKGTLNREISDQLDISIKTVEIHRSRMMNKLGVKNIAELINLFRLI